MQNRAQVYVQFMHMTYAFVCWQVTLHQGYRNSHSSKGIRRYNVKTLPVEIATCPLLILFQTPRTCPKILQIHHKVETLGTSSLRKQNKQKHQQYIFLKDFMLTIYFFFHCRLEACVCNAVLDNVIAIVSAFIQSLTGLSDVLRKKPSD